MSGRKVTDINGTYLLSSHFETNPFPTKKTGPSPTIRTKSIMEVTDFIGEILSNCK